jgi:tetratricopeptide (TPR) repeat protein
MTRIILSAFAVLAVLWLLLGIGVLPEPVERLVEPIVGLACSLAVPMFFLTAYAAPGLLRGVVEDTQHFWRRLSTRRRDVDELERKIAHLGHAYHMHQLGVIYSSQGRMKKARALFERAHAKDPAALDTKYQLGLCEFADKHYAAAAELLEQVHAEKPGHDYGKAYLRLAQSQHLAGNRPRADEIYQTLLRFYSGHPEGSYYYGLLKADEGKLDESRQLMRNLIFTVRHSPRFHRRINRHWAIKARWWLWRHRA